MVLGFFVICCGVILLQLSKSAKDVPDTAVFKGDLDQVREVAEQQEPESEPKADAIRGTAAIIRRMSQSRQKMEAEEARRIHEEKQKDLMEPIAENEQVEWDGLRRRKTVRSLPAHPSLKRRTAHPPLGMSSFPEDEHIGRSGSGEDERGGAIDAGFAPPRRGVVQSTLLPAQHRDLGHGQPKPRSPMHPVALTEISLPAHRTTDTPVTATFSRHAQASPTVFGLPTGISRQQDYDGASESRQGREIAWADNTYLASPRTASGNTAAPTPPPHATRRQFSFQNVFHRHKDEDNDRSNSGRQSSGKSIGSRKGSREYPRQASKNATEEERMGLVTGDSTTMLPLPEYASEEDEWQLEHGRQTSSPGGSPPRGEKNIEDYEKEYEQQRKEWAKKHDMRDSGYRPKMSIEKIGKVMALVAAPLYERYNEYIR